jgi:prevent-host-death family protein
MIMVIVTIQHGKAHFAQLIPRVLAGEEIIVARGKEPVVKIVPIPATKKERTFGSGKGMVKYISPDFDESLEGSPDAFS